MRTRPTAAYDVDLLVNRNFSELTLRHRHHVTGPARRVRPIDRFIRVAGTSTVAALTILAAQPVVAVADATPVISRLDASTAGHVTGTVSSGAPYVRVQLGTSAMHSDPLPVTGGVASFDLPTWGYDQEVVRAVACAEASVATCDTTNVGTSSTFTATDVTPTVTWPTDLSITHDQPVTVTVDDSRGGGALRAVWVPDAADQPRVQQDVARQGSTELTTLESRDFQGDGTGDDAQVGEGPGTLSLWRCRAAVAVDPDRCRPLLQDGSPLSQRLHIDHSTWATGVFTPDVYGSNAEAVTVRLDLSDPGDYTFVWRISSRSDTTLWASGETTFTATGTTKTVTLPFQARGIGAERYELVSYLNRDAVVGDDFYAQVRSSQVAGPPRFSVDNTGPAADPVLDYRDFFPAADGYRDTLPIKLVGQRENYYDIRIDVEDPVTHRVLTRLTYGDDLVPGDGQAVLPAWDGRDANGQMMPAGEYDLRTSLADHYGNRIQEGTIGIYLHPEKLVRQTWRKTVTATASLYSQSVGSCSQVRRPASRRWAYSFTLASGIRCVPRTYSSGLASTVHRMVLPDLPLASMRFTPNDPGPAHYDTVAVTAYGGAAVQTPTSTGAIRYLTAAGKVDVARTMTKTLGVHAGYTRPAPALIDARHAFRWNTYASSRRRYDIKQFVVTLTYTSLR